LPPEPWRACPRAAPRPSFTVRRLVLRLRRLLWRFVRGFLVLGAALGPGMPPPPPPAPDPTAQVQEDGEGEDD
jgi:hypothetical protein